MESIFDEKMARSVTTREEAPAAIKDFIREGLNPHSRHNVVERSRGYDLYLPWLLEVIEYVQPLEDREHLAIPSLHRLYMDAAWDLVMQGLLRPGPKDISSGADANAYGRAYSLIDGTQI